MSVRRAVLAVFLCLLAVSPGQVFAAESLVVLAASSLTEGLEAAASAWTAKGNLPVTLSVDASSRLARQVEAGVPADVFFSADLEWMDHLERAGRIDPPTRRSLLGNTLVVVVPSASTLSVRAPADLARVEHLALAGENVPAGRYARAALSKLGAWDAVKGRVVSGDNVRTVLGWVAGAEAEAGVVYGTDARVQPKVRVAYTFPPDAHPPIVYAAAVVQGAPHAAEAKSFLEYCASPAGMALFVRAGFTPHAGR